MQKMKTQVKQTRIRKKKNTIQYNGVKTDPQKKK